MGLAPNSAKRREGEGRLGALRFRQPKLQIGRIGLRRKGSPISVSGQMQTWISVSQPFFLKSCLCLFWPLRAASRRDSFLSFRSLLAEATFPSGKVIRSVTHLVPACRVRPGVSVRSAGRGLLAPRSARNGGNPHDWEADNRSPYESEGAHLRLFSPMSRNESQENPEPNLLDYHRLPVVFCAHL